MGKEYIELALGRLRLSVKPSSSNISLYWDGARLTTDDAFMSIIGTANRGRYYSDKALWQVSRVSANKLEVLLRWPDLSIMHLWEIILRGEKMIAWKVYMIPTREIAINEQEAGLMLSTDYTRWMNSYEEGSFPEIAPGQKEWQDIELEDISSRSIGVKGYIKNGSARPSVILDFRGTEQYTQPEIRNSNIYANLRGLLVLIKHSDDFRIKSMNERYAIFSGEIKLMDSDAELTGYIKFCKKEARERFRKESYLKNRKKFIDYAYYLLSRFKDHYRGKGILYVMYRGIAYINYCLRAYHIEYVLCDIFRFKRNIGKRDISYSLESGRLQLFVNGAARLIDIYWDGIRLTEGCGFITIIGDRIFRRYYSDKALWDVNQYSSNHIDITLSWFGFPVAQTWKIILEEEKIIRWQVSIIPKRKITLAEKEAGIMVSRDYTHWINSYEEGEFLEITPEQREWEDMKFWNLSSKTIGVRGCMRNGELKPAILFGFEDTKEDSEPKIRNSDYQNNLRALFVHVKADKSLQRYSAGKLHNLFSGRVDIIDDEKVVNQHILNCKQRLYRERVSFIEEKMPRRYLSRILKPVEVFLVNLPWKKGDRCGVRAGSRWPHIKDELEGEYLPFPFFLAHAASILLEHGISVRVIDAVAENMDCNSFINLVNELEPALLIAEVSTPSLKNDLGILKEINKKSTKVAICGADFNIRQLDFLKENNFIDFVMVGEYEYTVLELFEHVKRNEKLKEVLGLIYRENGDIKINPPRPLIDDLDSLPWPLREQLPMEQYMDAPGKIPYPSVQMWASRGCPFGCTFCVWPQLMYNSRRYRMRKAKFIVDEMEYLIKERRFKSIYFDDDTFNINKKNVLDICREIRERRLNTPWAIMARADTMDEEMLIKMKGSGLHAVKYGVESAEQKLVNSICKNINLKKAERMIRFTKSLDIKTHLTFTFGLPGETDGTIKKTIDYAIELNPDTVQFSIITPYPGTEYYKSLDAKGYIMSKDWSDYDGASKSVIRTEHLFPEDLEKAKDMALRIWGRHKRRSLSFFNKELRAAFKTSLENKGLLHTFAKTSRYIADVWKDR